MPTDTAAIRTLLQSYQDLYRARDVARLDEAMKLFVPDEQVEMVGTEAVRRGGPDWALGHDGVRALTEWDWRYWLEVELDVAGARVAVDGAVAWVTLAGALVQSERGREGTCAFVRQTSLAWLWRTLADEEQTLEQRLVAVAQVAAARARELQAPVGHRWALTFSAVLVRRDDAWLFHTTHWALAAE
jgi:hypothetical protein